MRHQKTNFFILALTIFFAASFSTVGWADFQPPTPPDPDFSNPQTGSMPIVIGQGDVACFYEPCDDYDENNCISAAMEDVIVQCGSKGMSTEFIDWIESKITEIGEDFVRCEYRARCLSLKEVAEMPFEDPFGGKEVF